MSDYIETLRSKYDAHFGSEPSTVFPGHEYWDDSAGVPAIDVFVYRKEDTGRPHDVLITAGMSRQSMNFLPTYEGERWASELIWYSTRRTGTTSRPPNGWPGFRSTTGSSWASGIRCTSACRSSRVGTCAISCC